MRVYLAALLTLSSTRNPVSVIVSHTDDLLYALCSMKGENSVCSSFWQFLNYQCVWKCLSSCTQSVFAHLSFVPSQFYTLNFSRCFRRSKTIWSSNPRQQVTLMFLCHIMRILCGFPSGHHVTNVLMIHWRSQGRRHPPPYARVKWEAQQSSGWGHEV